MKLKSVLSWTFGIIIGFAAGWFLKSQSFESARTVRTSESPQTPPPNSTTPLSLPSPHTVTGGTPAVDSATTQTSLIISDLRTLAAAKKKGLIISINVFGPDTIDPTFARVYGLSPEEISALNEAIKTTKERFNALAIQNANAQLSPDGSRLVVKVPSLADQGGPIYDQLLQSFRNVLGPDRFQSFTALSGDIFDSGFGSFGISRHEYEVTLATPMTATRDAVYRVNLSSESPSGTSSGTLMLYSKVISTQYPVLSHFIAANFGSLSGRK